MTLSNKPPSENDAQLPIQLRPTTPSPTRIPSPIKPISPQSEQESDSDSDSDKSEIYHLPLTSPIRIHTEEDPENCSSSLDNHLELENERGELLSSWKNSNQIVEEEEEEEGRQEDWSETDDETEEEDNIKDLKINQHHNYSDIHLSPNSPTSEPSTNISNQSNLETGILFDERRRSLKRRKKRRLYGGGRLDDGGELEVWEVALGIASDILSPAPLFIPHAFLLLGLPIGLPVIFLTAFLSWFSHVVLVVCGRYVGGRTYAQIASAVLPDRCKGFNLWFGESIVELSRLFIAGGRGMVNMMMVSDLFAQLTRQYTPQASILYSRVFIIALVALLSLIPNFLRPRRPIFLPTSFPTLSRLPLFLTILWPIALGIIGFRLRQLNKELGRKLPPSGEGDVFSEIMGGTVWGGFTIILFCLTTPQNTFTHLRSLKRINKLQNFTHPMIPIRISNNSLTSRRTNTITSATPDSTLNTHTRTSLTSSYTLRRYSWEYASFLGVLYSTLVCLGWGLVGYLGMDHGGYEVNFLASLPSADPWISTSRLILLIVLIPSIPISLRPATTSLFHFCRIPFIIQTATIRRYKLRLRGSSTNNLKQKQRQMDPEWDDQDEDEELIGQKVWVARFITIFVWFLIAFGAIKLGGSNGGEGSSIEMLGCVGSTIMTGILPALFFVVLFHVRKARSIFITDPRSSIVQDELLLRKESQLQRRLNGRRLWQDVCVFGLLLPYCLVVLLKGLLAALTTTKIDYRHENPASWFS